MKLECVEAEVSISARWAVEGGMKGKAGDKGTVLWELAGGLNGSREKANTINVRLTWKANPE